MYYVEILHLLYNGSSINLLNFEFCTFMNHDFSDFNYNNKIVIMKRHEMCNGFIKDR